MSAGWLEDASKAIAGAARLAIFDKKGLGYFDNSARGFWRSFLAILFIIPLVLYIFLAAQGEGQSGTSAQSGLSYLFEFIFQVIGWFAIVGVVSKYTGRSQFFARYVIVYNWASLLITAVIAVPVILLKFGVIGVDDTAALYFTIYIAALVYEWFFTRLTLETNGTTAFAIVLGGVVFSFAVASLFG